MTCYYNEKNFALPALFLFGLLSILIACSSDSGDEPSEVLLRITDVRNVPVANVGLKVEGDLSPLGNTDSKGEILVEAPNEKIFLITDNSGNGRFAPASFVNPDWFGDNPTVALVNIGSSAGQLDLTLNGVLSDQHSMAISLSNASRTRVTAITPTTAVSISPIPDVFDLVVTPFDVDLLPQDTYFANANNLSAQANTNLPVQLDLVYGGKQFNVNITNGYPDGTMLAGYRLYNQPNDHHLLTIRTIGYSYQDAINNQMVTIPTNNSNAVEYSALLGVSTSVAGTRITRRLFNSVTELNSSNTDQNITLQDFGLSVITPVNEAANMSRRPIIQWQLRDNSISFIYVGLYVGDVGSNMVWQAYINSQETSIRYPDSLSALEPNQAYRLHLSATKLNYSNGRMTQVEINRSATISFQTGEN